MTPLMIGCGAKNMPIVEYLVSNGANIHCVTKVQFFFWDDYVASAD
jgi:hypothetical protein